MPRKKKLEVQQNEDSPVSKTVLADAIVSISKAMTALSKSGLNRRAIITLVHDSLPNTKYKSTKICSRRDVEAVFDALESLEEKYCA